MRLLILDDPQPFPIDKDAEAFVLITTALGEEKKVLESLKQLDALTEAHNVHGSYDIVARFRVNCYDCLSELLNIGIKKIEGVKGTRILLIP
jgi:DNA-binding Lrp family transcriptional regulator